ncbi:MAG: hypothetical protein Q9227_004010 [Pyrenula ochraceoflavens]
MEKFLRNWRQDCLSRGQHDSAVFIGDKVLALTDSDEDAYWLARVHFESHNYTRALALLSRPDLVDRSLACRYLAAHCHVKQHHFDQALSILGEQNPTHLISTASNSRRKLKHAHSSSSRHVTLRNGKASHRTDRIERSEEREQEDGENIRHEAYMCYLRGLCFAKRNAFDRARDCYKDAVLIDVQCYEAFEQLMKNSLLSPAEELEFLNSLDFDSITVPSEDASVSQQAAHFTKMLYTTRLSKYASPVVLSEATEQLSSHYKLADNPDLLLSRAETLFTQCRFQESLAITSSILKTQSTLDPIATGSSFHLGHNPTLYPLHLACLYETARINDLFLLSHTLADNAPNEPYTYLAIGVYYLSISKVADARRYFSKASLLDPHSAPAWIGFAHTFAAEGEHDQAIAAYSTAARLFQGSHLPQLFLGMQHLALNNMNLAHKFLAAAHSMSSGAIKPPTNPDDMTIFDFPAGNANAALSQGDPLVLNELGVILYHESQLPGAAQLFRQSLAQAAALSCSPVAWLATRANLAHALRRMSRLDEALAEFEECLRISSGSGGVTFMEPNGQHHSQGFLGMGPTGAAGGGNGAMGGYEERNLLGSIHTSKGLVLMGMHRNREAVTALHEAVRVLGGDAGGGGVAGTLLGRAMEIWAEEGDDSSSAMTNGRTRGPTDHQMMEEEGEGEDVDIDHALDNHAEKLLSRVMQRGTTTRPLGGGNGKGKAVAVTGATAPLLDEDDPGPEWMNQALSSPAAAPSLDDGADTSEMMGMSDDD